MNELLDCTTTMMPQRTDLQLLQAGISDIHLLETGRLPHETNDISPFLRLKKADVYYLPDRTACPERAGKPHSPSPIPPSHPPNLLEILPNSQYLFAEVPSLNLELSYTGDHVSAH